MPDLHVARMRLGRPADRDDRGFGGDAFEGTITSIAPAADPQSRLFRIEVSIANRDGAAAARE